MVGREIYCNMDHYFSLYPLTQFDRALQTFLSGLQSYQLLSLQIALENDERTSSFRCEFLCLWHAAVERNYYEVDPRFAPISDVEVESQGDSSSEEDDDDAGFQMPQGWGSKMERLKIDELKMDQNRTAVTLMVPHQVASMQNHLERN